MIPVADLSPLILPCLQHSQSLNPKLAQILVHVCVCARAGGCPEATENAVATV